MEVYTIYGTVGSADKKLDRIRPQEGASIMYTYEKRIRALQKYEETGSVTETIRTLGYPERQTLYRWIQERDRPVKVRSSYRGQNTPSHSRHPPVELKLEVLHRCFELGEDVKSVADEIGYSRASIYVWRRKYLRKGTIALMTPNDDPRGELKAGIPSSSEEVNQLKAKIQDMQMEIDILKETINVLKKDPGIDLTTLKNREKAAIIDALKSKYSLPKMLLALRLPHSSYYYQQKALGREDKYVAEKERIREIFEENHRCYGYRRIHASLYKEGIRLSEKVIRRLMKENGLRVMAKKKRAYNSYRGEITPSVPNLLQRDFHANMPNEKWLTDITEFAIPAGKVYLSPMIDCFDGMPVCWNISTTPDAALVVKPYREPCIVQPFCKQHIGDIQKLIFVHWIGNRRSVPCGIVVVDGRHFIHGHDTIEICRGIQASERELFAFGKPGLVNPLALRPDYSVKRLLHCWFSLQSIIPYHSSSRRRQANAQQDTAMPSLL